MIKFTGSKLGKRFALAYLLLAVLAFLMLVSGGNGTLVGFMFFSLLGHCCKIS